MFDVWSGLVVCVWWVECGLSCGLGGELAADRVEVDQGGGPGGLQSGFGAADVAALAGAVAVGEQAEQPLDPWSGAAEMLGGGWVFERLAGGEQQLLVRSPSSDLAPRVRRGSSGLRAGSRGTVALGSALARSRLGGADRRAVPGRASDRPGLEVDLEVALAQPALGDRALGHRGEHLDAALGQLGRGPDRSRRRCHRAPAAGPACSGG